MKSTSYEYISRAQSVPIGMPNANMLSIKISTIHKCRFQVIFARISGLFFFTKKDLFLSKTCHRDLCLW